MNNGTKQLPFLILVIVAFFSIISCSKSTKKPKRPNILIAIMDDATYSHMGAYGSKWVNTPAFDRVANEGILFSNAYTPNAKCAPSRSAILTGRNSWQLEEAANHWCYFPKKFKTYAEALSENGYHVGYTAKGWAPGISGEIDGKKRQLAGQPYNEMKTTAPTKAMSSNDYTGNFVDFLDKNDSDEPFCFWYGSTEPHRRYTYGSGIEKGGKKLSDIDKVYSFWPDNDSVRTDMLDYAYEIEYFDAHLGKMIDELEKRGELENTLIVVTADNGMPFPRIKGQEYELSNHLPLAVMWLGGIKIQNRVVDDFISFIDFAPTFLDLAGVDVTETGMQPIEGKSLKDIFYSSQSGVIDATNDHVLIGKERHDIGRPEDQGYPIRGIVKGGYLYVHNFETSRWPAGNPETGYLNCDGSPTKTVCLNSKIDMDTYQYWEWSFGKRPEHELYNIKKDPECMQNLAEDAEHKDLIDNLKNQLIAELTEQKDPRVLGNGDIFDSYKYADKGGVNFYDRYMNGEEVKFGWVNASDFEKQE